MTQDVEADEGPVEMTFPVKSRLREKVSPLLRGACRRLGDRHPGGRGQRVVVWVDKPGDNFNEAKVQEKTVEVQTADKVNNE